METVAPVLAILLIMFDAWLAVSVWRRLSRGLDRLLLWSVMLFPCISTALMALAYLVSRFGRSALGWHVLWSASVAALLASVAMSGAYQRRTSRSP